MKSCACIKEAQVAFLNSSFLRSADYDENTYRLVLTMHNGKRYLYSGVPKHIYDGPIKSGSKGRFYDTFIRGKFPSSRC
ncbi:KTSC domain-containing protein [Acetobacter lovaniensis]|uniref:KTSC domain-containing protein n=1 Tax=Acetobacter lovaniensis TaxID=104100 RepID=UPI0038D21654